MADDKKPSFHKMTDNVIKKLTFDEGTSAADIRTGKEFVGDQIDEAVKQAVQLAEKQKIDVEATDFLPVAEAILKRKGTGWKSSEPITIKIDNPDYDPAHPDAAPEKIEVPAGLVDTAVKSVVLRKAELAGREAREEAEKLADRIGDSKFSDYLEGMLNKITTSDTDIAGRIKLALDANAGAKTYKEKLNPVFEDVTDTQLAALKKKAGDIVAALKDAVDKQAKVVEDGDKATNAQKDEAAGAAQSAASLYNNYIEDVLKKDAAFKDNGQIPEAFKYVVHAAVQDAIDDDMEKKWGKVSDKSKFGALSGMMDKSILGSLGIADPISKGGDRTSPSDRSSKMTTGGLAALGVAALAGTAYIATRRGQDTGQVDEQGNPIKQSGSKWKKILGVTAGAVITIAAFNAALRGDKGEGAWKQFKTSIPGLGGRS